MLCSFSALDEYFGVAPAPLRFERFEGDLVGLASAVEGLGFPGLPYADAVLDRGEERVAYSCADGSAAYAYPQLGLTRLPARRSFDGRGGAYEALREPRPRPSPAAPELVLFEAAALASRYGYEPDPACLRPVGPGLPVAYQRDLLELVLTGARPGKGLDLLLAAGFVDAYWPELAELASVSQAKDYHPEGDAWRHTLETFGHRKGPDLVLSLGLLLHDTGKPDAVPAGGRRFDGHSELGEKAARAFLSRLGYSREAIGRVAYLVRYHMLPAALPRLPPSSVSRVLDDPLFPTLLELYRCDELSTFRGPDGYYDACAAYKAYLKNSRNPYRDADGKARGKGGRAPLHTPRPGGL